MDVRRALLRGLVRELAHHHVDVGFGLALVLGEDAADLDGFQRAGFHLVRGHEGLVVGQRVDVDRLAVDVDERDIRRRRRIGHRLRRRCVDRIHDDRVDTARDEVVDLVELLGDIVLRILDLYAGAVLVGVFLDAVAQNGQKVVVELGHRHADILGQGGRAHERGKTGRQCDSLHSLPPERDVRRIPAPCCECRMPLSGHFSSTVPPQASTSASAAAICSKDRARSAFGVREA